VTRQSAETFIAREMPSAAERSIIVRREREPTFRRLVRRLPE
jgi:hypothetical protein